MEQYNCMLQGKPGITSIIWGYGDTYNAMEYDNKNIDTLNNHFTNYAACQIQTDRNVSALSEHNKFINQHLA